VEAAPDSAEVDRRRRAARLGRDADNAFVRAVGRLPLSLRAKLLIGFGLIAALLALAVVLGVVALGQSNARSGQLGRLQQRAVYVQLLLTDATQLKKAIDYRLASSLSTTHFGSGLDQTIANDVNQLCDDVGLAGCVGPSTPTPLPLTLGAIDPALLELLASHVRSLFSAVSGVPGSAPVISILKRADGFAGSFATRLAALAQQSRLRATALVAANRSSFAGSPDLLIGVGSGSLALALALGLLLSWSVVAPLRRTERRLAELGTGDFSGRLEVANRDEIGALAWRVNRMSDELQRVYRELELASEHKSQFLANMSHEVRTPLNAIIGFSQVLHEQMFGELNERQHADVEDVLEAGRHLLSLINDVLDLAKIEAGKMELELSQVALPEVLRSAISIHSERASRGGVELALGMEPEAITIAADERRVRQIVFNLVSNAVKFTPPEGRVDLSARLDDGQVEISVADTGPGIPPEDLEKIFEEFEQTAAGKQAEGTGLGLPLSRKLVELHGGRLWAETQPGKGSTFRFVLPIEHEE
jgi:signal transduction histidine kinase